MEEVSSSSSEQRLLERILDGKEKPTDLQLALLQTITGNFSEERKIGHGGFGAVYKGILGERNVAVKRIYVNLERIDDDDKQFGREFTSLWNTNHQNVVRFLGFCSNIHQKWIQRDGLGEMIMANVRERLFCFEYISNGSLDKHITDELRGLEWETRYEIITGICKGLQYLHEEKTIIHMDLQPENILLDHQDEKYIPKITDFGLSRPNEKSYTVGKVYGTRGYCAPEYSEGKNITPACDIYSLGAIIRELVTGCMEIPNKDNARVLRRWRHRWRKPPTPLQYEQVTRCIEIAVRCREKKPEARPSISEIISFLSESESMGGHTGQEISTYLDDDMLGIEPLELCFTLKLKKDDDMHGIIKLTNKTEACFAFNIERPSKLYTIWPDKGIVPPGWIKYPVQITVQPEETVPQVTRNADKFIVRSMKVSEGLGVEGVTEHMFRPGAGKVVDEVDLMVLYGPVSLKRGRDPNVPVDVVSHKAVKSSIYNKFAQGQCTNQQYRHNFQPPESFSQSQLTNMTYLVRDSDRAMDVTRGAMGSLLHKLGVLHKEFNLETSVKKDANNLVKMQQVLRQVSYVKQDNLNDMVKLWACDAREMSYDLEDFVDGFLVYSDPYSNGSGFGELTHEMYLEKGMSHQPISDLIKHHISKQVQDAAEKCKEYNIDNTMANATTKADIEDPRFSAIYIDREQLIGIEEQKQVLIRLLEEDGDASKLKIVSIVGLGGLGKTTLAKAVYDKLKAQYNTRAFVPVGRNPDVKEVLKDIIYEVENKFNAVNLDERKLRNKVNELLENKRYFIVIDDIWDTLKWNGISCAFPENKNGSRVMITTRDRNVALACSNESKYVHEIKPLSAEEARRLFFIRAFGPEKDSPVNPRKEEISKYILKRCGGMPLAIITIASLLNGGEFTAWENIRKSLGAPTEGKTVVANMNEILDLSYIHLPDDLKTCLLYVCKYPQDREIDKIDLLREWVAEGFVCTKGPQDAEDVAEDYFQKLINKCMLQPGKIDYYSNEILSCRVHDIILDLMRSKSTEVNFNHVIDASKHVTEARGKIRRVSVHYNYEKKMSISETMNNRGPLSHVRSVLLYGEGSLVPYFLEFKYVRILHFECSGYDCCGLDFTGISRLFLLRYLKVAGNAYPGLKLPDQIGNLQQLETIDIDSVRSGNLPSDIIRLPRLLHLRCGSSIVLPDGIDRLKSLRTLEHVCFAESTIDSIKALGELTNLSKLQFSSNFDSRIELTSARINALHSSISKLSAGLKILKFGNSVYTELEDPSWSRTLFPPGSHIQELYLTASRFEKCPEWIGQLHNLYSLSIKVREVADGFTIVGGLLSLAYFCLHVYVEYEEEEKEENVFISGSGAFKALKHLRLHIQHASLTFEQGALPMLEKLEIVFGSILIRRYIPVGIEHLPAPTLKQICLIVGPGDEKHWKVKGSQNWSERDWDSYSRSDHYKDRRIRYDRKSRTVWKRAFKKHQPNADIYINFMKRDDYDYPGLSYVNDGYYTDEDDNKENLFESDYFIKLGRLHEEEDDSEEHNEDAYHDEDYHKEDYYSEEDDEGVDNSDENNEADRGAPQGNGSETPAQAQANTRQLVELMEVQEDSGRVSINTDAPLMVHTSVDLAVGSERWQGRRGSQDLSVLEYSQLPFTGLLAPLPPSLPPITWPDRAKPVANFPVDINNNLLVEHGNAGMLVNVMGQYLHLNQASTGRLVDLNRAYLAVLESSQLPSTSLLAPLPPSHPPFTWPETAEPVARFPVDISNDLLVQQGHNDLLVQQGHNDLLVQQGHNDLLVQQGNISMLINAVAQYLDLNQAPTSVLVDLNHAYLAVVESLQLPFTSDLLAPNQACNQLTEEEFLELSEYPYVNQAPPGGLAELNQAPNQLIDEEFVELSEDI